MRARVAKEDIMPAVIRAVSIADKKSVLPILSHVMLDFNSSGLRVKATDLDHSIVEDVNADVDTFGVVAVPAGILSDIVRKASDNVPLEFSLSDKGHKLLIVSGMSKFELSTLNPADFPEIEKLKNTCALRILCADFNRLLGRTKFSMSTEESRHNLNGIYLHKDGDQLKAASTDGHRLSVSEISMDVEENLQGVIISKKTVFEIKKLLESTHGANQISITFTHSMVQFEVCNVVLMSKLVDGNFPDYKRVIPDVGTDFFTVKRSDFISIIDRVAVISDDKSRSIKLEINKNTLACYVANSKVGNGRDEISIVNAAGLSWSAGFNANYLLDVANALDCENLKIFAKESLAPILLEDASEKDSIFVIMPMRI